MLPIDSRLRRIAQLTQGRVDSLLEALNDDFDVMWLRNKRRSDNEVVASYAVNRPSAGIDSKASRQGVVSDATLKLQSRVEGSFGVAVFEKLNSEKKPSAADVPDVLVGA